MTDNRCPSRLTTESLDFTGPMTFQCTLGAGHFPLEPHTWALVWTDLGADDSALTAPLGWSRPIKDPQVITDGRLHSVSLEEGGMGSVEVDPK